VYLIYLCAIAIYNTARSTGATLQDALLWNVVRDGVRRQLGEAEADTLPDTGPGRYHWTGYQPKMIDVLPQFRDASRDVWIAQALAMGCLSEYRPRGSRLRPDRSQVVHGDATVVRPPSDQTEETAVDEKTGELRRHRVDHDAGFQIEGGDRTVYGKKIVTMAVRRARTPHSRIILNMDSARHRSPEDDPDREEEASTTLRLAHEILDRAPGVLAFTQDTVWRGKHRAPLIARGVTVFTRQHDGATPRPLKHYTYTRCNHRIYTATGRACELLPTVDGVPLYNPLPVRDTPVREGKKRFRFYHDVEIPCPHGPHRELIPVYETREDRALDPRTQRTRFNRTEHIRQIPPLTDFGRRLLGFRQDSESHHSNLDYSHRDKRVPAYGTDGALLLCLGHAWVINSIALGTAHEHPR
ncbi:hypothetical protein, partial [Streptomyces sp. YPW6]|uniref:hypothetical protein n=1 Tax=Streptomyces sp. YPW6 TaxID=2840373 RepID=UPI003D73512E